MGLVLYLFGAVALVLVLGWAVYVLPLPGELTPWELTGAFVPALLLLGGVLILAVLFWLVAALARFVRHWRHR